MTELPPTGRVVVVGASLAGTNAAATLRREGFDGEIVVVDADPAAPYDRPPLSKQVIAGEWEADRLTLLVHPGADDDLRLTWRIGTGVEGLDLTARELRLRGGDRLAFDGLVIATGARARRLPGTEGVAGIHHGARLPRYAEVKPEHVNPALDELLAAAETAVKHSARRVPPFFGIRRALFRMMRPPQKR